jgi:hypothetical protein
MKSDFYIYEWFNVDTGEVFYVGKGRKDRYRNILQRNQYFKNYYNKYKCDVRKVQFGLSEDEAFELEIALIEEYRQLGQCKCNLADGGEGCTFPEGTWNDMFRKLQYLHDIKGAMDNMPNEDDYDPKNLKNNSLDELHNLYNKYIEYQEGIKTFNSLVFDKHGNINDGWEHITEKCGVIRLTGECMMELAYQSEEVSMLTQLMAENVARKYKQFKEFLNYKTEFDFECHRINTDKFLELILSDSEYLKELMNCIVNNIELLKIMGNTDRFSLHIKVKSYSLKGRFIHIKCNTVDDKSAKRVKLDLYDIVWGILMFKNKVMYQLIYQEIFSAPFI